MTQDAKRLVSTVSAYYDASLPPGVLTDPHINSLTPNHGVVSTLTNIVVAGVRFAADAVIEVAGQAIPTSAKTPTSLTGAYTPAAVGPRTVTVRNVADAQESNNATFTVTATAGTQSAPDDDDCPPNDDETPG
jgi:hypothetical protein